MPPLPQLPALEEVLGCAHVVAVPTVTRFRGVSVREAVLFDAPAGASEFSPFLEYDDAESSAWLAAAIEFGWGSLPPLLRTHVPVNATVPAVSAAEVAGVLARFDGCRTVKVKVAERGQTLADDVARVREVRAVMGDEAVLRVDANGGWSTAQAISALEALAPFGLDYAEQPCATVPELAAVRAAVGTFGPASGPQVRIAADESVRKAEDPLAVAHAGAADLLVIKAQPLGGVRAAMRIVAEAGLPVVVSSALDTSVGISMGAHLAAALPDGVLDGACGLGTAALLAGDVTDAPLVAERGELEVRRPALSRDLLAQFAAEPARTAWWRERIRRCYEVLAAV